MLWLLLPVASFLYYGNALTVVAPHLYTHDLSIALCTSGACTALEVQHYHPTCSDNTCFKKTGNDKQLFHSVWELALQRVCQAHVQAVGTALACRSLDVTSVDITPDSVAPWVRPKFQSLAPAARWVVQAHHGAHAAVSFYSSPFDVALALVVDGVSVAAYHASRSSGLTLLADVSNSSAAVAIWSHCIAGAFGYADSHLYPYQYIS